MKVFVEPLPSSLSRAMHRVAGALRRSAPEDVKVVYDPADADLQVIHATSTDAMAHLEAKQCVIIQYCYGTGGGAIWRPIWRRAKFVWSYYDLSNDVWSDVGFLHTPLGIDDAFTVSMPSFERNIGVMTSGYIHGQGQEAIEEPSLAAAICGLQALHLGPRPVGMTQFPPYWRHVHNVTDATLASYYRRTRWVSGLRHTEGFEFPVIEGLACGARPVVFDHPETRHWFGPHALYVPECEGDTLVQRLVDIFSGPPEPVSLEERTHVLRKFSWSAITTQFWAAVGANHADELVQQS